MVSTVFILALAVPIAFILVVAIFTAVCWRLKALDRLCSSCQRCIRGKRPNNDLFVVDAEDDQLSSRPNVIYRPRRPPSQQRILFSAVDIDKENSTSVPDVDDAGADSVPETPQSESLQTSYYIPMNKNKTWTSCRSPPYRYPTCQSSDIPQLPAKKPWVKTPMKSKESDYSVPPKPIPVARCSPFRTSQNAGSESESDNIYVHVNKMNTSRTLPPPRKSKRMSYAEIAGGPVIHRPRELDSEPLKYGMAHSDDDLFKDAWWRSTQSLESELRDDDYSFRYNIPHDFSPHNNSMYVEMALRTSLLYNKRTRGDRVESKNYTHPNRWNKDMTRSHSCKNMNQPCLSPWSETVPVGLQITAELKAPLPRPCTLPRYVNFNTPSMAFECE